MSKNEEPAATWEDPKSLVPWGKNPRRNSAAVKKVAESIRTMGFGAPIVCRRENREIIAGHTRHAASLLLGLARVPVRFLDVSASDAHKLAIADNKLGELSEWDDAALAEILGEFSLKDCAAIGFDAKSLEALGEILAPGEKTPKEPQMASRWCVIVDCNDESHQVELLDRFAAEGLVVKAVMA